jgi:glutamate/tyrosine decarboxylase-like PLP-dependent enzyme
MEALFREEMPVNSQDPQAVLARVERDVFGHIMHPDHPRFFAFVPGPGNFVGALADALASGFNVFSGTWLESAGPAEIELVTVDWLRAACGLPETAGGLFTSGGSAANLAALATARQIKLGDDIAGAVIYCSDQTHSSVLRALRILGFKAGQLRSLPADESYRLNLDLLRQAVTEDRATGLRPFCVVASAGTTNTGAIDPLPALADFCRSEDLWLHADGAFGASAVFCGRGRALLDGLGQVDSLSIDPHKWLFQPFESGCLLVRDRRWLRETFHILPEYLEDTVGPAEEVNFCDYGPQLTRRFRALKLWMSLQVFGEAAFSDAVERGFILAELVGQKLNEMPGWRVVTPAQMGIITFRAEPVGTPEAELDTHNQRLVEAILEDGYAVVVSTRLRGQSVLRMCTINPRTTEADIRQTLDRLDRLSNELL